MAWKKYRDMSPEEKKSSWAKFRNSSLLKKKQEIASRIGEQRGNAEHDKKGHRERNPGGYCPDCGHGRDYS